LNDSAVRTDGLSRTFSEIRALDGLTIEIPAGSIFGLLGPNGAGKTTTLRLLLGLLDPSAGSCSVFGYDPASDGASVRRQCGVLLEHPGLYERMTAEENLIFFGRAWGVPRAELGPKIAEVLDRFGLGDRQRERVEVFSRGMKQRLALARALIVGPRLLLMDEPTAGLDPVVADELRHQLRQVVSTMDVTLLLSTHNLFEAEELCDKVAVLNRGRLVALESPTALRRRGGGRTLLVRGAGLEEVVIEKLKAACLVVDARAASDGMLIEMAEETKAPDLVQQLIREGVRIEEVRQEDSSFEDVVLELMRSSP
jgi:ABC-2 type transport system ATP-binding protein